MWAMQIDVFSFGILLWEMLTGQLPWGELSSPMQVSFSPGNVIPQAWQSPDPTQDLAELLPMLMLALAVAPDLAQRTAFLILPPLCFLTCLAHTLAAVMGAFHSAYISAVPV